jgi:hypothetical protein
MDALKIFLKHYGWMMVILLLFGVGGSIYFDIQPLGLTFILGAIMLLISMENSDMIHAVEMVNIEDHPLRTFFVHFSTQRHIARFIYYYQIFVYGYILVFAMFISFSGVNMETASNIINIFLLIIFFISVITIFIRMILVGTKMNEER